MRTIEEFESIEKVCNKREKDRRYDQRETKEEKQLSRKVHRLFGMMSGCLCFFFDFTLFFFPVVRQCLFPKKVHISKSSNEETSHDLSEMLEDILIVGDKKYSEEIDRERPDDGSDHVVEPKVTLQHLATSRDKWDKGSSKIMEFSEDNIPESIFFDLFFEDIFFGSTDSEPFSIFMDEFFSVVFSDPVSHIVPDHSPEDRRDNREKKVLFRPKSSD
jgi:hypothetical protein